MGLVAAPALKIFKILDESIRFGLLSGGAHLRLAGTWLTVKDIIARRAVKHCGFLRHCGDRAAKAFLGDLLDILTINQDLTAFGIVKPQKQSN